jgi:hypothetical protein
LAEVKNMNEKTTKLKLVNAKVPKLEPPRALAKVGRNLWDRITSSYNISDEGGREMLAQCCAAADRAEACTSRSRKRGWSS